LAGALSALAAAGIEMAAPHRTFAKFTTAKPPAPKPTPPTLELAVAIASDPDGVAASEQAALEFGKAIAAMFPKRKPAARVAWHSTKMDGGHVWTNGSGLYGGSEFLTNSVWENGPEIDVPDLAPLETRLTDWAYWHVAYVVKCAAIWEAAIHEHKTVPATSESLLVGKSFAEIANPWAPLMTILRCGYALSHHDKDVLYLAVPT